MVKCKKCGIDDLTWDTEAQERTGKWSLWNPNTERPHQCIKKKDVQEEHGMSKQDKKLWKKSWNPEMDLPSKTVCGICEGDCVVVDDCPHCEQFKLNPCKNWCPKCNKHPNLVYVTRVDKPLENLVRDEQHYKNVKKNNP